MFSYSDVQFNYVMTKASIVNAAGVSFRFLGNDETMIKSTKPVVSVIAVGRVQVNLKLQEKLYKYCVKPVKKLYQSAILCLTAIW